MRAKIAQVTTVLYHLTMNAVCVLSVENQEETGLNANLVKSGTICIVLVSKPTLTSKLLFGPALIVKTDKLLRICFVKVQLCTAVSYMENMYINWIINTLILKVVPLSNNWG